MSSSIFSDMKLEGVHPMSCGLLVSNEEHISLKQIFIAKDPMAALEITARHCRKEMELYGECVASKPSSWQQECHSLKVSVAQCTSSHPVIKRIRQECAEPFLAFEQCLKQNQSSALNCTEHVTKFLTCAEKVNVASEGVALSPQPE